MEAGGWKLDPANGHLYREVYGVRWDEAEAYAVSLGGHLATINDAAEDAWLAATFTDRNLWIGFNDRAVEGTWVWASGEPVIYRNWCDDQPDDWQQVGGEDNGWMNAAYCGGKKWDDADGGPSNGIVELAIPASTTRIATNLWRAKIGTAGANGSADAQRYVSGMGSIVLKLARLRPSTYLPVTLSRGTCASLGGTLIRFPAIRTTRAGTAARSTSLTAAQVSSITAATKAGGRMAIRIGSGSTGGVKCGVFAVVPLTIGVVIPSAFRAAGFDVPQAALRATGYSSQVLYSQDVASERIAVDALIGRGAKVLILGAQDGAKSAAAADAARAAGVKVIAYVRPILGTASVDYLVTTDNLAVGAAQAQYLIDRAGSAKGANLYLYTGAASDPNSFAFLEGAWERLQPRIADGTFVIRNSSVATALAADPTLTHEQQAAIIAQTTTNWDPGIARIVAAANLAVLGPAEKGTVFVLCPNDSTALALAGTFAADPAVATNYLTGQDAIKPSVQAIVDGRQGMTVFKDPRVQVTKALVAAATFLAHGTPSAPTTFDNGVVAIPTSLGPVVPVTRENLQAALIDSGYYRASDFTGTWPGKS